MTYDSSAAVALDSRFDTSDVICVTFARVPITPEPIRRTPKRKRARKRRAPARAAWRDDGIDPYVR